jgi:hypothetical protein
VAILGIYVNWNAIFRDAVRYMPQYMEIRIFTLVFDEILEMGADENIVQFLNLLKIAG